MDREFHVSHQQAQAAKNSGHRSHRARMLGVLSRARMGLVLAPALVTHH